MKNNKGFTLVELMVVILIVGAIMAYALPSYQAQVRKAKRTEAKKMLLQIASAQEKHYAIYNHYATNITVPSGTTNLGLSPAFLTSNDYTFILDAVADDTSYGITATAIAGSTQVLDVDGSTACNVMNLNSIGAKTPLDCWQ